jgi:hypothetical protein
MKIEEGIKTVIESMMSGFEAEKRQTHAETIEKLKELRQEKNFMDMIEFAQDDFMTCLEFAFDIPPQKNKFILRHILSGLYEHFINTLMRKTEGSACSTDKSRFITRSTLKALEENNNLSLYNDYSQCEQITEDKEQQAYWSPKTIPDTNTAMKLFWDWYLLRIDKAKEGEL